MKRKALLCMVLTLVLCFSIVFVTSAAQTGAKDLVLAGIKNFDPGVNKAFYEKSQDVTNIKISEFDGSLTKDAGPVKGASIDLISQLDAANNTIKISYTTDLTGNRNSGSIYLHDDKVIFTKDLFFLLKEFGLDVFKDHPELLEQNYEYLYVADKQMKSVWEQMAGYQNQQLPEEYKEILLFLVEAIPDQYFSLSNGKVTLALDQNGLENSIYNLLVKIKAEKERAADIVINLNKGNFEQMGITPAQMKQEIITGIDTMPVVTPEEIKLISSFVELKAFTYEAAVLPGGAKNFNMELGFKVPDADGSVEGQFAVVVESIGANDDLEVAYSVSSSFNAQNGPKMDFLLDSLTNYKAEAAYADTTFKAVAIDNTTGELLLNFGATAKSSTIVDHNLRVDVPSLNDANSIDITYLLTPDSTVTGDELRIVINGSILESEVNPSFNHHGEIMVPARAVAEALGCEVAWHAPDKVQITTGDKTIFVFINQVYYQVNGVEKTLSAPALLEKGYTMLPGSFIVEELGANMEIANGTVVITK